jgi:hypothetical protein
MDEACCTCRGKRMQCVGECCTCGEKRISYKLLLDKAERNRSLETLGIDVRIILKWILNAVGRLYLVYLV